MIRTIIWFIKFWLFQFKVHGYWPKIKKITETEGEAASKKFIHQVARDWAKLMVENSGSTVNVTGLEKIPENETVLFVSNHQANFDIPILLGYLPKDKGFVAKIELKKFPMISTWMEAMDCVFLDRKNTRKSLQTILDTINLLKSGHSMIIFPEGTRSKSSKMGKFKKGSLKIAQKANVPIVPITINGSYNIMGTKGMLITPANVDVIISDPIRIDNLSEDEKNNLASYVQKKIADKLK